MKYIISTTGSKIPFMLTADKKFVFDTVVPTEVEDTDSIILFKRLGAQLKEVTQTSTFKTKVKTVVEPIEDVKEMSSDEDGEAKDVE